MTDPIAPLETTVSRPYTIMTVAALPMATIMASQTHYTEPASETEIKKKQDERLVEEIEALAEKTIEEGWDGEGTSAVEKETIVMAEHLVRFFPLFEIDPEISATPHGEIDFDWIIDKKLMLTVSACPSKEVAFAGLIGAIHLYGQEKIEGTKLPDSVSICFDLLRSAYMDRNGASSYGE